MCTNDGNDAIRQRREGCGSPQVKVIRSGEGAVVKFESIKLTV